MQAAFVESQHRAAAENAVLQAEIAALRELLTANDTSPKP
jgi:hypothetical protein